MRRNLLFERAILAQSQSGILDETGLMIYADWLDDHNTADSQDPNLSGNLLRAVTAFSHGADINAWAEILQERPINPLVRMLYANSVQHALPEDQRAHFLKFVLQGALAQLAETEEERAVVHIEYEAAPNEEQYVSWRNAITRSGHSADQFQNVFFTDAEIHPPELIIFAEPVDELPDIVEHAIEAPVAATPPSTIPPPVNPKVKEARDTLNFLPASGRHFTESLRRLDNALSQARRNAELNHNRLLDISGEQNDTTMILHAIINYARNNLKSLETTVYRDVFLEYIDAGLSEIRRRDKNFDIEHALDPSHIRTNNEMISSALVANARTSLSYGTLTFVSAIDDALARARKRNRTLDVKHALDPTGKRTNDQMIGAALLATAKRDLESFPDTDYFGPIVARTISASLKEAKRRAPDTAPEANKIIEQVNKTLGALKHVGSAGGKPR